MLANQFTVDAPLGNALDGTAPEQLLVYFQPKVSLPSAETCAYEALLRARWQDGTVTGPATVLNAMRSRPHAERIAAHRSLLRMLLPVTRQSG